MSNMRVAGLLLAVSVVLTACDRSSTTPQLVMSGARAASDVGDAGVATSLDGTYDEILGAEVSADQAATGGRASGHVGFTHTILNIATESYSFVALSIAGPPANAAKGQVELMLETTTGTTNKAHSEVICLGIVGNRARVGARITKAWVNGVPFPLPPGGLFTFFTVTDNGEGSGSMDLASLNRFTNEAGARFHCAVGFVLEQVPIDDGNVQVSTK